MIINYINIAEIPVIEIIHKSIADQPAPLAVFYHGWTSNKDASVTFGMEIAKRGFRVVIPEAVYHGQRRPHGLNLKENGILFFNSLQQNIEEFPDIIEYYQKLKLIADDFVTVSGMSMGGMTTSMLFRTYTEIKSSVILMGSPQQLKFNNWVVQQLVPPNTSLEDILSEEQLAELNEFNHFFAQHDLSLAPESIEQRPLMLWHAQPDEVVPALFTVEFYQQLKDSKAGAYTYLQFDEQGSHKVPFIEMARMAEFLKASYKEDKAKIWTKAQEQIHELFG